VADVVPLASVAAVEPAVVVLPVVPGFSRDAKACKSVSNCSAVDERVVPSVALVVSVVPLAPVAAVEAAVAVLPVAPEFCADA
jgi:hypothetical protein